MPPQFEGVADFYAWLNRFTNYERMSDSPARELGVERIASLLKDLGNPHSMFRSIHVAGTNGKGSTCMFAAALLSAHGVRTGLYTSPHVTRMNERIQIDGRMISDEEMTRLANEIAPVAERCMERGITPTYFDLLTALAFLHFARCGVGCAVVEVGMGGRLDSTNVVHPEVCAITSIGFDHQDKLGHALPAIAGEKAGILKQAVPVVLGRLPQEAAAVARDRAEALGCAIEEYGRDFVMEGGVYRSTTLEVPGIALAARGGHQQSNFAIALRCAEQVLGADHVKADAVRTVAAETLPMGRLQIVARNGDIPAFVVDGGHNEEAIAALCAMLESDFSGIVRWLVFSTMQDKDYRKSLRLLLPHVHGVVVTTAGTPRSLPTAQLRDAVLSVRRDLTVVELATVREAITEAARRCPADGVVVSAGSFYTVAPALDAIERLKKN